jgi:tripartite-type tricarboxylate transporter receptor subunit TctC
MPIPLATLIRSASALAVMALLSTAYAADPVRLVVAFPPGGPADPLARVLAKQLDTELKTNVIVENKPGGNGAIAAAMSTAFSATCLDYLVSSTKIA